MEADYVIVGAGSAGSVLADRLSASGRHSVLVLEAGGSDRRFWLDVPIGYGKSFYDPRVNWMYRTEPEDALAGRRGYWPRGKVLGGSSAINAMVYVRGQPRDFDEWRARGNPGWGFDDVLPYFRKMEAASRGASAWRGGDGPLAVTDPTPDVHPLCEAFLRAGEALGYVRNADFNAPPWSGVGIYEITTRGGRRMSTARAYLHPAMRRGNVRVVTDALADRVRFEGTHARAVAFSRGGVVHEALAHRAVILAAGAIGSPAILQRSGVGPKRTLAALGISVVRDAPAVGANLQDHLCIDHLYRARVPTLNDALRPLLGKLAAGLRYLVARRGPLALSVNQAGGFVAAKAGGAPDLQLYCSPLSYTRAPAGKRPLMSPDPFPGFLLSAQPCRPTSRGSIAITSREATTAPRIVPNSLSTSDDLAAMIEGSRLLRRLAATPALAAVIAEELAPGAAVQSDDALVDDIRRRAGTVFHPVGTCAMGPDTRDAVVDARLAVHGIAGLRVVDASIFPSLTSGNTNAPTIMVAERAADLIAEDAR
jgi:choline dehydrogenase